MRYYLIVTQIIFLCIGVTGQSITGETYVCPGDIDYYYINDDRCASISSSDWNITNGSDTYFGFVDAAEVQWYTEPVGSVGIVSVTYVCNPSDGGAPFVEEDLTLDVEIRQIQTPFFDEPFVERPLGDNSSFPIATPDQGANFLYFWSFPDCLPGTDGSYYTTITPDMYGTGTVCLTVYDNTCGTEITECIEVTRSCEDIITYTTSDDIPFFTSADLAVNTMGNVATVLPYVEFKAGVEINLNPGFFANEDFLAHIGECGRSPDADGCIGQGTTQLVHEIDVNDQMENSFSQQKDHVVKGRLPLNFGENLEMNVFPNPARDNIAIAIKDYDTSKNYKYEILALNGKALRNGIIMSQETSLDVKNLDSGIYFIKVQTNNGISVSRLVKI